MILKMLILFLCLIVSGCGTWSKLIPSPDSGIHSDVQIAGTRKAQIGDEQHVKHNEGQIIGHQTDQHVQRAEIVHVYNMPPWWVWMIVGVLGIIFTVIISFLTPSWVSWQQQIKRNKFK